MSTPRRYPCTVRRVLDGDSLVVDIDLGLGVVLRDQHCRLEGIDTPELTSRDELERVQAQRARLCLTGFVMDVSGKPVEIEVERRDKYGRWLARVFVAGDCLSVNQGMLNAGHARVYGGGAR